MGKRLYVGNLPYDTDEGSLRDAFGQDGRVVASVHLVMDRETGRPRGFAFVEMQTDEEAKKAIAALDGQDFRGRMLRINEAEDRRPGGPSGPGRGPNGPPRSGGFSGSRPAGPAGGVGPPRPVGDLGSGPRRPNFGADSCRSKTAGSSAKRKRSTGSTMRIRTSVAGVATVDSMTTTNPERQDSSLSGRTPPERQDSERQDSSPSGSTPLRAGLAADLAACKARGVLR